MIQKYGGKNGLNLRISSQNQHISPIPDFEVFFEILKKKGMFRQILPDIEVVYC